MANIEHSRQVPTRSRALVPLAISAAVVVIVLGAVLGTLLLQHDAASSPALAQVTRTATRPGATRTATHSPVVTATPRPPQNVPAAPMAVPPPAHPFSFQQNAAYAAAPTCPPQALPANVVAASNGYSNETTPVASPSPVGTATATPTTVSTPTATPTEAPTTTIPVCGTGQPYGPNCSSTLPGPTPTYDQERQALYNASVQYGMSFSLIEAVAWQESGWQQNVVACDGGVGTMQLMPDTTKWLNQYYKTTYSAYTLADNASLGVGLLRYLYLYYLPLCNQGLPAGQTCSGDTVWPGATDGATLRDIIISAYNEGAGTMGNYGIINWWYVNSVNSLRTQFLAAQ